MGRLDPERISTGLLTLNCIKKATTLAQNKNTRHCPQGYTGCLKNSLKLLSFYLVTASEPTPVGDGAEPVPALAASFCLIGDGIFRI